MELFAKIVNGWKPWTIFAKSSIVDVWHGSEYTPGSGTEWLFVATKLLREILLTVVLTVWDQNADEVIIYCLSILELSCYHLSFTYLSQVDKEIEFFQHFIFNTFYITSQKIWHKFTKSSKIGLSIESFIVDLFEFFSDIARFSFLDRRNFHFLCQQLIWRSFMLRQLVLSVFVDNSLLPFHFCEANLWQKVKNYPHVLRRVVG